MTQRWKAALPRDLPAEGMAHAVLAVRTRGGRHEVAAFNPGMPEARAVLLTQVFNAKDDLFERLRRVVADYAIEKAEEKMAALGEAKPYRSQWLVAQEIHEEFRKHLGEPVLGKAVSRLMNECPGMFASTAEATSFMLTFTMKPKDPAVILKLYRLTTQRKEDRIACTDWLLNEFHGAFDTLDDVSAYLDHGKL